MNLFSRALRSPSSQTLAATVMTMGIACAPAQSALKQGVANGVRYAAGGAGIEARKVLTARAADYSVMLVFAHKDCGEYLADVTVRVQDAHGQTVVALDDSGPIVLLGLAPGEYRIDVTHRGDTRTRSITVGERTRRRAVFYWTADPQNS